MSIETVITTAQIICVLVLAIGTPVYAYLKLAWRAEAAEKRARSERLRRLAAEAALEQTVTALSSNEQLAPLTSCAWSGSIPSVTAVFCAA
jgi:hypothetical protein